ncbi:hypothetical protein PPROV_000205000 [Pycnococcus provasolii]|uniref:Uncharacterized protein n=1 Tax=Pycnococcus provasolii TaxID=41880 RepID=A0A830H8G9_9CHLO|nr:hypothetical protein PPROV_000205000 [Pycnococcus provasolii]
MPAYRTAAPSPRSHPGAPRATPRWRRFDQDRPWRWEDRTSQPNASLPNGCAITPVASGRTASHTAFRSCVNRPDAITDFHRGGYEYWRLNCLMRLNFPTKA